MNRLPNTPLETFKVMPGSHKLTGFTEFIADDSHFILRKGPGYLGNPDKILELQRRGFLVPEVKLPEAKRFPGSTYIYQVSDEVVSLKAFLNSTKVDAEAIDKRRQALGWVKSVLFRLDSEGVSLSKESGEDFSYLDLVFSIDVPEGAENISPSVLILPNGIVIKEKNLEDKELSKKQTQPPLLGVALQKVPPSDPENQIFESILKRLGVDDNPASLES